SILISASAARLVSLTTAGVAAVALVSSPASIVNGVEKMVVPASRMSMLIAAPVGAVVTEAFTPVTVNANGILNVTLASPTVRAVVSSLQATTNDRVVPPLPEYLGVGAVVMVSSTV